MSKKKKHVFKATIIKTGVGTEPLLVGYARVSTDDQSLDLQMDALTKYGVEENRIWTDKRSGATLKREGLRQTFMFLEPGDTLVVWRLDRIARSITDLLNKLKELDDKGVKLVSLTENIDTASASGRFLVHVMAAVAEFERQLVSERTKAGLQAKIARGYRPGPDPKLKPHMAKWAQQLRDNGFTAPQIVEKINNRYKVEISPRTVYLRTKRTK
ncbi:MAG: recombinase family protein [Pseudomonadota bacterium]